MRAEATTGGSGRDPCFAEIPLGGKPSTWIGPRTKPHSDKSSKVYQMWNNRKIVERYPACSVLTHEEIFINILGDRVACSKCGCVPWNNYHGEIMCECGKIWNDPADATRKEITPDTAIYREQRNRNYQKNMRRFFNKGGRG